MGLEKTKEVDNLGVSAKYWRPVQLNTNFNSNDAYCTLQQYVDSAGREAGKNPVPQSVQRKLENYFLAREVTLSDSTVITMRELILRESYGAWKTYAAAEQTKIDAYEAATDEEKKTMTTGDAEVAFFSDAIDA